MEIMSLVLEVLIVLEIGAMIFFVAKRKKNQPNNIRIQETSKMVKKILLNNKWENIDNMIEILKKDSVHIDYRLR